MQTDTSSEIEHLHRSLQNAQETIRFVDTKSTAVASISVLLVSGALALAQFFILADPPYLVFGQQSWAQVIAALALLGSSASFVGVLVFVAYSILARPPSVEPTLLFPYYPMAEAFDKAYSTFKSEPTADAVRNEFYLQLRMLGVILSKKLPANRKSVIALLLQLGFTAAFAVIGLFFTGRL